MKLEQYTGLKRDYLRKNLRINSDFINLAYAEEVDYWKRAALGSKNEEERKQLMDLAPSKVFFGSKRCWEEYR